MYKLYHIYDLIVKKKLSNRGEIFESFFIYPISGNVTNILQEKKYKSKELF